MYMRRGFIKLLAIAFFSVSALAAAADVYSVTDYGAMADGTTLNTEAIQSAIDACAAGGGGTVHFPAGDYLSGTIFLKSHVRLNLDHGTRLLGSTNTDDYPPTVCRYPSRTDAYTVRALIWGEGLEDVAITGYGTIDGQGAAFRDNQPSEEELAELAKPFDAEGRYTPASRYAARPYLIRLVSCRDVLVENVRMRNSAMWMQHYLDCDFVTIRGINVYNHGCANNDMIDIDCCRNVIISDCFGDSDDDALTLKSTGDRPTEHVTITNCVLRSHCNAIKAGTESSGGFKDITISNCVLQNSSVGDHIAGRPEGLAGLALEIVDGGSLERVTVSNLVVKNTTAPIFLRLGNRARPSKPDLPTPPVGTFRDVYIDNVVATGASVTGCSITGLPGHPIENVSISNVRITFNGGGTDEDAQAVVAENEEQYPESTMFGTLPAYGFYCRHVDGLKFNNIDLAYSTPDKRPALVCDDVSNLAITSFNAQLAPDGPAQFVLGNVRDALIQGCVSASGSAFLQLTGSCESVAVMSNDLSRTTEPFDLRVGAESALYMANNRIKGGQFFMSLRLTPGDENRGGACRRLMASRVEGRLSVARQSPRDSLIRTLLLNPRVSRRACALRGPEHVRQIAFLAVSPSAWDFNREDASWILLCRVVREWTCIASASVCVRRVDSSGRVTSKVREFGTMTEDILALGDWLETHGVTQVAMESTGVYWKPLWNLLEDRFTLLLCNPREVKQVPGRKTDTRDCQWLAQLLQYGLLRSSFVPPRPQRELRDLTRHRAQVVGEKTRAANRIQKILEDANIKLACVASDVLGKSGRLMLEALMAGETDPKRLADLAQRKMRSKIPQLRKALQGGVSEHHRYMLRTLYAHVQYLEGVIASLDARIAQLVDCRELNETNPGENALPFAKAQALLETVPGIDANSARTILAETGTDMSQFPTPGHFASWAGLCPGNNESAGKRKSGKTTNGNRWLKRVLTQAAWAASHTKNTYLSAQFRRLAARRGKKRALVATAHSILVSIYAMLEQGVAYADLGPEHFHTVSPAKRARYLQKKIEELGYLVTIEELEHVA